MRYDTAITQPSFSATELSTPANNLASGHSKRRLASLTLLITVVLAAVSVSGCSTVAIDPEVRLSLKHVRLEYTTEGEVTVSGSLPEPYSVGPSNGYYSTIYTAPIGVIYDLWHYGEQDLKQARVLRGLLQEREVDVVASAQTMIERTLQQYAPFAVQVMPAPVDTTEGDEDNTASESDQVALDGSAQFDSNGFDAGSFDIDSVATEAGDAERTALAQAIVAELHDIETAPFARQLPTAAPVAQFVPTEAPDADAQLAFTVDYGVSNVGVVDESWLPWVRVTGVLTDTTGEVLWRYSEEVNTRSGDLTELPFPAPFRNHSYVKRNFEKGARVAVRRVLENLFGGKP